MSAQKRPPPRADDVLGVLDRAAGHVIEARALLASLPPDRRGDLAASTDALLLALGRRIAAHLPPAVARDLAMSDSPAQPDDVC